MGEITCNHCEGRGFIMQVKGADWEDNNNLSSPCNICKGACVVDGLPDDISLDQRDNIDFSRW